MLFQLLLALQCLCVYGYYVPGWSIRSFKDGEQVPLYVNKITSDSTQLPFAFSELPFACPLPGKKSQGLNLGEVLHGDRIRESAYDLRMKEGIKCQDLCELTLEQEDLKLTEDLIHHNYLAEWIVDNLPGATAFISLDRVHRYYAAGFPIGSVDKNTHHALLNNHVTILIRYRADAKNPGRSVIVGFEVYPKSISNDSKKCATKAEVKAPLVINPDLEKQTVRFTYSVYWREDSSVEWVNRWDSYFSYEDKSNKVHWISIINSIAIVGFLSVLVVVILVRTLSRDIANYKQQENLGDSHANPDDVSGWKLVDGDVFRLPDQWDTLLALVGSGVQLFVMAITVVGFACLGFINPSYRGGMLSTALFFFAFSGIFAGYVNVRLDRDNNDEKMNWVKDAALTGFLVPAAILLVVLTLNMVLWINASSSALPFGTIVALFCIWLLISCPLVLIGGFIGSKPRVRHPPGRVASIPRQIPPQPFRNSTIAATFIGGSLPFIVIFTELAFVLKAIWQEKSGYYYVYGFLGLVSVLLVMSIMEMSIVMTYWQLNSEDYHWWWRSFFVGAGSAVYVFLYSVYYFYASLHIEGFASSLLFFGYSLLGCAVYALITGSIGFIASYFFVRKIYTVIKAE